MNYPFGNLIRSATIEGVAPQSTARPPLRADAARNRERILEVARKVIAGGDLAPALNDIARQAGVGVGTVYRHFADHRALLEALVEDRFCEVLAYARAALAEKDPEVGVANLFRATLALALADPSVGAVLSSDAAARDHIAARMAELFEVVDLLLGKARKAGVIRSDLVAVDVWHLVCGVERAVRAGGDSHATAERYTSIVLAGLRPGPGQAPKQSVKTKPGAGEAAHGARTSKKG